MALDLLIDYRIFWYRNEDHDAPPGATLIDAAFLTEGNLCFDSQGKAGATKKR